MEVNIKELSKKYGTHLVLDNISLDLEEGNIYALVGKNGAGKSTLFNLIADLLPGANGHIQYDKIKYDTLPSAIKRRMGIMTDIPSLIEELTAWQHLKLMAQFYSVPGHEYTQRIEDLLHLFFSNDKAIQKKIIKSYSTGMKKKLEICTACLHTPDFLMLDEPFTGLDPASSEDVIEFIRKYQKPHRTILFSSHNLEYIERLEPILILLDEGGLKFKGTVAEFTKDADKKFHERLLEELHYSKNLFDLKWL